MLSPDLFNAGLLPRRSLPGKSLIVVAASRWIERDGASSSRCLLLKGGLEPNGCFEAEPDRRSSGLYRKDLVEFFCLVIILYRYDCRCLDISPRPERGTWSHAAKVRGRKSSVPRWVYLRFRIIRLKACNLYCLESCLFPDFSGIMSVKF